MKEKLTKIWVTKYALTTGIFEVEAEVEKREKRNEGMAVVPNDFKSGTYPRYFHGKEWHLTKESAMKQAEEMRTKKIASLQKQIGKLENLKF